MSKKEELEKEYEIAIEHVFRIAEINAPTRVKAEYIGCKTCGSRLAKKYIKLRGKVCNCPLCGSSLFSNTAQTRIKNAEEKARKIKMSITEEQEQDHVVLPGSTVSFKQALNETRDRFEYILEEHETPYFTEVIGNIGGDVEKLRVYKDGSVSAK